MALGLFRRVCSCDDGLDWLTNSVAPRVQDSRTGAQQERTISDRKASRVFGGGRPVASVKAACRKASTSSWADRASKAWAALAATRSARSARAGSGAAPGAGRARVLIRFWVVTISRSTENLVMSLKPAPA